MDLGYKVEGGEAGSVVVRTQLFPRKAGTVSTVRVPLPRATWLEQWDSQCRMNTTD